MPIQTLSSLCDKTKSATRFLRIGIPLEVWLRRLRKLCTRGCFGSLLIAAGERIGEHAASCEGSIATADNEWKTFFWTSTASLLTRARVRMWAKRKTKCSSSTSLLHCNFLWRPVCCRGRDSVGE
eukprot:5272274-Amphidinium_carterae.2